MATQQELDELLLSLDALRGALADHADHLGHITLSDVTRQVLAFPDAIKERVSDAKHHGALGIGYAPSPLVVNPAEETTPEPSPVRRNRLRKRPRRKPNRK